LTAPSPLSRVLIACLAAVLVSSCATPPGSGQNVATEERAHAEPAGALNADVRQATIHQTICVPGWTATVRPSTSYTNGVKLKLLREQGLAPSDAFRYELDHYVPLELGGHPRDLRNLWLQLWDGEWGAKTKDRLEVKMKTLVCSGRLTLASAQEAVRVNWRSAYRLHVGRPPLADGSDDRDD
jgi:hypothetical protein